MTSFMTEIDDEGDEIQTDEKWITEGKVYDFNPDNMSIVDDSGFTHYVSTEGIEKFFIKLEKEKEGK